MIQTARQKVEASEENCKQIEKSITECREKIEKANEKKTMIQSDEL